MHDSMHAKPSGRRPARRALGSLLLLATLLVVGCSSKPAPSPRDLSVASANSARATILESVPDSPRRDRALEIVDQLFEIETDYVGKKNALVDQLSELNADYDADRGSFTDTYDAFQTLRVVTIEGMLEKLQAMELLLDEDEWSALADNMDKTQGKWSAAQ